MCTLHNGIHTDPYAYFGPQIEVMTALHRPAGGIAVGKMAIGFQLLEWRLPCTRTYLPDASEKSNIKEQVVVKPAAHP